MSVTPVSRPISLKIRPSSWKYSFQVVSHPIQLRFLRRSELEQNPPSTSWSRGSTLGTTGQGHLTLEGPFFRNLNWAFICRYLASPYKPTGDGSPWVWGAGAPANSMCYTVCSVDHLSPWHRCWFFCQQAASGVCRSSSVPQFLIPSTVACKSIARDYATTHIDGVCIVPP
jgi:hypothetical protein